MDFAGRLDDLLDESGLVSERVRHRLSVVWVIAL